MSDLAYDIVLEGRELSVAIGGAVASVDYDENVDSTAALTIVVRDQRRALWASPIFDRDANGRLDRLVELTVDGAAYRLAALSKSRDAVTLTAEDRVVSLLRFARGQLKPRDGEDHVRFAKRLVSLVGGEFVTPTGHADVTATAPAKHATQRAAADKRRERGIAAGAVLNVKGEQADANQLRNMELVMGQLVSDQASEKVTLAAIEACIVEDEFRNSLAVTDHTSVGILQLLANFLGGSTSTSGGRRDVALVIHMFVTVGFWSHGGAAAIAKAHPQFTAGNVAQWTQGSAFPDRYDQFRDEASAIIAAYGATGGTGGGSSSGAPVAVAVVQRGTPEDPDESSWTALQRISKAKGYRCFADRNTIVYAREQDLIASRPRAILSEDLPGVDWIDGEWLPGARINTATASVVGSLHALPPGCSVIVKDSGPLDGRWLVSSFRRPQNSRKAAVELRRGTELLQPEATHEVTASAAAGPGASGGGGALTVTGGAKGIVEQVVALAIQAGGTGVYMGSGYRPGSTTTADKVSDHAFNSVDRAARDIGVRGINLITGPPSAKIDRAAAAIGRAFGRDYGDGARTIIDQFVWQGFRIQIIWRTPRFGGHEGHLHCGARRA